MAKKKRVSVTEKPKVIPIQVDAAFFFERAVRSLDRYHYDKALKYFRRAVEFEPDNPVNYCNLAGVLSEMGNYSESNEVLQKIVTDIDQTMTECHFYMANNFANMEDFEAAENALAQYLENDPEGHFLDESEEMMEMLSYELERPLSIVRIKSKEDLFEHDKARMLLEEGKFHEAVRMLEKIVRKQGDFLAAHNNLALAYFYVGHIDQSMNVIEEVLKSDPGNLHALCNLAVFYKHLGETEQSAKVAAALRKVYPYHPDHMYKLATTMGILGEHPTAYRLFKRLIKYGATYADAVLYHYAAVASYNLQRYAEAEKWWRLADKQEPKSEVPQFYLSYLQMTEESGKLKRPTIGYHAHMPFEDQIQWPARIDEQFPEQLKRDTLVRFSLNWALQRGLNHSKLQVIQLLGMISDDEARSVLLKFILNSQEDDYLKKVAIFVLRSIGVDEPLNAILEGKQLELDSSPFSPDLPVWEQKWQSVLELSLYKMRKRYNLIQQHDTETLWVEYLSRLFPDVPKISKIEGWSAALEYLTAKMHRKAISYHEVAVRYGVSISTVSKNVKSIDRICGLRAKMEAILQSFSHLEKL